jgi:hypothetical protein
VKEVVMGGLTAVEMGAELEEVAVVVVRGGVRGAAQVVAMGVEALVVELAVVARAVVTVVGVEAEVKEEAMVEALVVVLVEAAAVVQRVGVDKMC